MLPAPCRMKTCSSSNVLRARRPGACGGQFTANTMACVSEAIGLALPHSAGAPAPYETRDEYAVASGKAVMELIKTQLRPRDIVTRKAFEKRRGHCGGDRRLDQCGPASAGHGGRGGDRLRPHGCLRDLPQDALHRRPQAGREVCRQGYVRRRRRRSGHQGAARRRLHAWRLHDGHGQYPGRELCRRETARGAGTLCDRSPTRSRPRAASSA